MNVNKVMVCIQEILQDCANLPTINASDPVFTDSLNALQYMQIALSKQMIDDKSTVHQDVLKWAEQKGIMNNPRPLAQFMKTIAEVGETADALVVQDMDKIKDGIGDIEVTLTILKEMLGFKQDECIEHAYQQIKDRTGKMINGQFVKD
jgi:NTP pyrophosphatase (non-canonical NTP hydrolase)